MTGIKFRFYGWIALIVLIITGVLNLYLKGFELTVYFFKETRYGALLSYKILLFGIVLLVSGIHDFYIGRAAIKSMQNNNPDSTLKIIARWSGRINLLLSLIIAFLGVMLSRGGF